MILAQAIVDCVADPARNSKTGDPIWNIGGPDTFSMKEQGQLIADVLNDLSGEEKKPWLLPVPISIFSSIVGFFENLANAFRNSIALQDTAELAKIGKYYAVEDMLTTAPAEKYGSTSLLSHYQRVAKDGQEYDPYTTILGSKSS